MPIPRPEDARADTSQLLPLDEYDVVIVSFSGGKDSMACALQMIELGVDPNKMELWHQAVDGRPGSDDRFFDWPITESYCRAFADAIGVPLLFQWKEGGFRREMLRDQQATAPTSFELGDGTIGTAGGKGPPGTRLKFPQVTADLSRRWCSAYLKIDVAARAISNDPRFKTGKFLLVTGERRQESGARSKYADIERHRASTKKRRVDQWRSVLSWTEEEVWDIIRRHGVRPHPAYDLGWSRVSCFSCIFGNPNQWAAVRQLSPELFGEILAYEQEFGITLRRDGDVAQAADRGQSFVPDEAAIIELALSEHYPDDMILLADDEEWVLPRGAFSHSGGPT